MLFDACHIFELDLKVVPDKCGALRRRELNGNWGRNIIRMQDYLCGGGVPSVLEGIPGMFLAVWIL